MTAGKSKSLHLIQWIMLLSITTLMMVACGSQEPAEISITLSEFSIEPNEVTVPAGEVNFTVQNIGALEHNFEIEGVQEKIDFVLPTETETLETTLSAGSYVLVCTVEGHREAGMVGTLIVEE
ncbi:MAG: hypothetical protein GWN00_12080 [Aliifodinibius sp.]|nr:hypothetical protein [Fodinibius sp.]NIY25519.1 hypothetical protein [Fodinibius sp.]